MKRESMKQFLTEWCKNMIIALVIIGYISIFLIVCYLLDDNTLKGGNMHIFMGSILCSNYSNVFM